MDGGSDGRDATGLGADLKAIGGMERTLFTDLERVVKAHK